MRRFIERVQAYSQWIAVSAAVLLMAGGIAYSVHLGEELKYQDEKDYYELAVILVTTGNYALSDGELTAFRAPGYPLLLAGLYGVGGGIVSARLVNFSLLAATVLLCCGIARRISGGVAAAFTALLLLGYPVLFYTAGTLYPQTLSGFLLALFLWLAWRQSAAAWVYFVAGVVYGGLVLTVPVFLMLVPLVGIGIWLEAKAGRRGLVLLAIGCMLAVGPWTIRNYRAFDAFVPVATNAGVNLWAGNNLYTTPQSGVRVKMPPEYYNWVMRQRKPLNEIGRSAFFADEAFKFMREHKLRFISLYVRKFLNYFNYHNRLATVSQGLGAVDWIMLLTYGPLLLLGVGRFLAFAWWRPTGFDWLCLALYLASAAIYALFFTRIRFRLPFDLLLIGVAAGFIADMAARWRTKE
jgi:4-amino-4-deoxy-L-arabinose transferase-like glycosyltransferase